MMSRLHIDHLRILLAAILAVAVILAPMSVEASHVEEQSDTHCVFCIDHDGHGDEDEDPNHHKSHHAHGCGGCHVHGSADRLGSAFGEKSAGNNRIAYLTSNLPSADTAGLFRPPRS